MGLNYALDAKAVLDKYFSGGNYCITKCSRPTCGDHNRRFCVERYCITSIYYV